MKMNEYMERTEQVVLHTYNRFPVVFEKGEGVHLYDTEGKEYLDFGAGIAVFALGYHYADYDQALKDQIDKADPYLQSFLQCADDGSSRKTGKGKWHEQSILYQQRYGGDRRCDQSRT